MLFSLWLEIENTLKQMEVKNTDYPTNQREILCIFSTNICGSVFMKIDYTVMEAILQRAASKIK